jgi:hypothetical protein
MGLPIQFPLINGHRYSFASIEALFNDIPMIGFKSLNYGDSLEPGEVYGSRSQLLGATRGKQKATSDFEMYRLEWDFLIRTLGVLGVGFGESYFDISCSYAELNQPVVTDRLLGCRIKKFDLSNTDGTDPTVVKNELFITRVKVAGVTIATPYYPLGI